MTIYLDYAATTPVDPRVAEAMSEILRSDRYQANAASTTHAPGLLAKEGVEMARLPIASLIGADRREIIFTSGATEANNLAILGVAAAASRAAAAQRKAESALHFISSRTEHKSVLDALRELERRGASVSWL